MVARGVEAMDIFSSRPFLMTFSEAAAVASGSLSMPTTRSAPNKAAAMPRIPVPVPTSRTRAAAMSGSTACSSSRDRVVVAWCPVPKAIPGSISMTFSSPTAE